MITRDRKPLPFRMAYQCAPLYHNKVKVTLLLYERTKLKEHLDKIEEHLFLEERGYQGFIDHEGRNYLCSGCWRVYKNVKEAETIFKLYEQAGILVTFHVRNGGGMDRFLSPDAETGQKKGDIYYEYSNYRRTRPYGLSV